jgi:tRNA uracil 4-sulfurtransferase
MDQQQQPPVYSLSMSGEVSTKSSGTRRRFHRRLRANLRETLDRHALGGRIIDRRDRIDIEQAAPATPEAVRRVFGVQSVRTAYKVPGQTLADLVEMGLSLYGNRVAGRRFAVRPRRVGKRHPDSPGSTELACALGQALVERGGQVDLDKPEIRIHVEIRPDDMLVFDDPLPGSGGLPLGTAGRGLALISGGFDSAVAAWRRLLRGMDLDYVVFSLAGWPQERSVREVLEILDERWMAGSRSRLHVVDFRPVVARMRQQVHGSYWQVLLKRMMMHAADRIAWIGRKPGSGANWPKRWPANAGSSRARTSPRSSRMKPSRWRTCPTVLPSSTCGARPTFSKAPGPAPFIWISTVPWNSPATCRPTTPTFWCASSG